MAALVSKRMASLLDMFTPYLSNATVRTAVNHLAVGIGSFKSEESDTAEDAASMLPLVNSFITAFLPHCNKTFARASTGLEQSMVAHVGAIGEVLMLAIKTMESAMEVTLRYEVQGAAELSR